ncbi:choline kinase family protein [Halotalea alkalilenta]|uniref:choline kinase family protein n=1 Tax=Halotalea alkalilenta TaxID=376489 RepID=UPI0005BD8659|nr:choline kinase family protein [Halotalea alkalilenta]
MMIKKLGEATTAAEREIEAAIYKAPLFRRCAGITYRPVSGGISNSNWRVTCSDGTGDYFVKLPGKGTEMFIDRVAALDASRKAAAAGIGPAVHDDLAAEGIEINDFMPTHRASTHSVFADSEARLAAIDAYRRFHALPSLMLTKTVFDMIDEHEEQVRTLGAPQPPDGEWIALNYRLARSALEASGLDLVPCFNDPMPGNFMVGPDGAIMLIDYEYASMNDRCYDLGIWFGEMFFSPAVEHALIEAYFGHVTDQLVARVTIHKALADIKWAAWSMVQMMVSQLEFDYFKYGAWKLMRFRAIVGDPAWKTHLSKV